MVIDIFQCVLYCGKVKIENEERYEHIVKHYMFLLFLTAKQTCILLLLK